MDQYFPRLHADLLSFEREPIQKYRKIQSMRLLCSNFPTQSNSVYGATNTKALVRTWQFKDESLAHTPWQPCNLSKAISYYCRLKKHRSIGSETTPLHKHMAYCTCRTSYPFSWLLHIYSHLILHFQHPSTAMRFDAGSFLLSDSGAGLTHMLRKL